MEPPSEEFAVLFDGEVLDPWTADSDAWGVRNGTIQCQSSSGGTYLVLKQANSASFELRLKYRLAGGRAAVVYRGARNGTHVDGYRAVLEDTVGVAGLVTANGRTLAGLGELTEVDAQGEPTVVGRVADARALRAGGYAKTGAWNDLLIAVRGDYLIQELNGNTTVRVIDRSTKAPKGDLLALHVSGEGSPAVEFKGIFLRRIDTQYGDAFRIFNGKDYSGWTYSSDRLKNTWSVLDGVMHNAGKPGGYIRTEKDYTSYHISLQIRHLTSGNSGVLLRMVGEDKVWPRSIECQGMYGNLGDIWNIDKFPMQADPGRTNGRHTRKMHGSNMRPVGEWNNYDILLAGPRLEIRVNGLLQNAADECWITPGKICLQSEGAVTQFANIVLVPVIGADR